jgi:hypothetical protein
MKYLLYLTIITAGLIAAQAASASVIVRPVFNSGLVGYWDFNEGEGSTAYDRSGNLNHGALTNMDPGTDRVDSKSGLGQALDFDGTDDKVNVAASASINDLNIFTFSAWIKYNGTLPNNQGYIGSKAGYNKVYLQLIDDGSTQINRLGVFVRQDGADVEYKSANNAISDNTWVHVLSTYDPARGDGARIEIYVNGKPLALTVASEGNDSGSNDSSGNLVIGSRTTDNNRVFNGSIDEVRVYNRALSADEVKRLYNISKPKIATVPMSEGLVGYWDFNEGQGSVAYDRSGNLNNGALTNMDPGTDRVDSKSGLGQALDFDGSDDMVNILDSNLLDLTNNGTLSWWGKINDQWRPGIMGKMGLGADGYRIQGNSSPNEEITLVLGSTSYNSDVAVLIPNEWHHYTITFSSASGVSWYRDGSLITSAAWVSGTTANTEPLIIGRAIYAEPNYYPGLIDEVRIYNRALSADEVKRLYNITKPKVNASQTNKLTDGLVGMWSFDGPDMAGVTAYDRSGQGNNGTLTNGPTVAIGKVGQALSFDGSDDYVLINTPVLTSAPMTVCAWFKANTLAADDYTIAIITDTAGSADHFELKLESTGNVITWSARRSSSASADTSISFTTGTWHHACAVEINSASREVYLDAGSKGTNTTSKVPINLDITAIGVRKQDTESQFFNGLIDEVRIYNRALTPAEINRLYQMGR